MTALQPRVAFDVTAVISGSTGIARYATRLGAALEEQGVELRKFAIGRRSFPLPAGTRHLPIPARILDRWWRTVRWPGVEAFAGGADLVHATGMLVPRTARPLVVTVHDMAALRYPELHPARHVRQQQVLLACLARASAIVSVSQATAQDLADLGIPAERIVVAPLGVSPLPGAPPAPPTGEEYLLTVGETAPRKRYDVVLRALARLHSGGHAPPRLVMAGPAAADEDRLMSMIGELGITEQVTRLGAVSDAVLGGLYERALALCLPSVSEGFGLPMLEAMRAGVPVLASDIPVTHEVAGDGALYLAVGDDAEWAQAIEALANDPGLRIRLGEAGRKRAGAFTWARTAAGTSEAYRLALGAVS